MNKVSIFIALILSNLAAKAEGLDLNDTFFQSGKYYVVVGVLTIIFLAVFVYLFRLDRRISDLEKNAKK